MQNQHIQKASNSSYYNLLGTDSSIAAADHSVGLHLSQSETPRSNASDAGSTAVADRNSQHSSAKSTPRSVVSALTVSSSAAALGAGLAPIDIASPQLAGEAFSSTTSSPLFGQMQTNQGMLAHLHSVVVRD